MDKRYNYTDMHLHTEFSWDAEQTIEQIIKKARAEGVGYICLTEHIDFQERHVQRADKFDFKGYYEAVESARKNFPDLMLGIEVGEPHIYKNEYEEFIKNKPIDFILASVHMISSFTPVYQSYFEQYKTIKEAYERYFEEVLKLVSYGNFDALAHLNLVHRRGGGFYDGYSYLNFKKSIDPILSVMAEKNIALEINTSGLRYGSADVLPGADVIEAFLKAGGRMITTGSDSHVISDTFFGLREACGILEKLGVKELTIFKNRKPMSVPIFK